MICSETKLKHGTTRHEAFVTLFHGVKTTSKDDWVRPIRFRFPIRDHSSHSRKLAAHHAWEAAHAKIYNTIRVNLGTLSASLRDLTKQLIVIHFHMISPQPLTFPMLDHREYSVWLSRWCWSCEISPSQSPPRSIRYPMGFSTCRGGSLQDIKSS
jgi:hypothetical protein